MESMEVDLCFVMDCTGSMGWHIEGAKNSIKKVVEYMKNMEAIEIRIGFCGYRDHCDDPDRLLVFDFANSCDEFENYLSNVSATGGGGDGPEDVLGGLNAAVTRMTWRNDVRVLLHIGDYPPHGRIFDNEDDFFPDGDPYGLTEEQVLKEMQLAGIYYFFGMITHYTETMIKVFKNIIGEFPVFDIMSTSDPEELVEKIFEAACSAINTAITLRE